LPAMSNVSTRNYEGDLQVMNANVVQDTSNDYTTVKYGNGNVSLRKYATTELQSIRPKLRDKTLSNFVGFVYETDLSNYPDMENAPNYLALISNGDFHPYVFSAPNVTTPMYALDLPLNPNLATCKSFPSCAFKPEQSELWYAGNSLSHGLQTTPMSHNQLPDICNPFSSKFTPTYYVDGLVAAELRNDLRYLSDTNLAELVSKGFMFENLYSTAFGDDWDTDPTILRNNPKVIRKPIVQMASNGGLAISSPLKTEAYYTDLILNKLVLLNAAAPDCKLTYPSKDNIKPDRKGGKIVPRK